MSIHDKRLYQIAVQYEDGRWLLCLEFMTISQINYRYPASKYRREIISGPYNPDTLKLEES